MSLIQRILPRGISTKQIVVTCSIILMGLSESVCAQEDTIHSDRGAGTQAFVNTLAPDEQDWLSRNHQLRVAVKSGWMPIEYRLEGDHRGIAVDYLREVANLIGVDFQIVELKEGMTGLYADIVAGVPSAKSLDETHFNLVEPAYLTFPYAVYVHQSSNLQLPAQSLNPLLGLNVAVFRNAPMAKVIHQDYPNIHLIQVDIADEAFEKIRLKQVDAYIGNQMVIDYHMGVHRIDFAKRIGISDYQSHIYMATSLERPELNHILAKALAHIGQNNPALINKWTFKDERYANVVIFSLFATLIAIVLLFICKLYRLNQRIQMQKEEANKTIWYRANYDYLTNLPNRHLLQNRIDQAITRSKRNYLPLALLYIDLDNFKSVNDKLGHAAGDQLLIDLVKRILDCHREGDTLARIGGDEFVLLLADLSDIASVQDISNKILTAIKKPFVLANEEFYLTTSIGIAMYPDDSVEHQDLMQHADQAMYEAKKLGKNQFQYFNKSINEETVRRINLANDLRKALELGQLSLHYQPIIGRGDDHVLKAEALIRWSHPEKGMVSPAEFIPVAESSGIIFELSAFIFKQAMEDLVLLKQINPSFCLNINVSPLQFKRPNTLLAFGQALSTLGLSSRSVCLEITESILLDGNKEVNAAIEALRASGIEFAIDDFGTGYSALAYLKKYNIDYVKIDQSFVKNLETNRDDAVLCEAIIDMGHKLGIKITAEGVETSCQLRMLSTMHVNYLQGYFFSGALPLSEFLPYIQTFKITWDDIPFC